MKRSIKTGVGCSLLAAFAFLASCERGGNEAIFETLENQNALLVEQNFQAIPGQYVVTLQPGTLDSPKSAKGPSAYKSATQNSKLQLLSQFAKAGLNSEAIKSVYAFSVEGFSATLSEQQLTLLSADPRVKTIEQDYLIILAPPPGKGPGNGGGGGGGAAMLPLL